MLDYPALAALAAVVREGGFERAAAVLGVLLGSLYGLAGAKAATSALGGFTPGIPWLWLAVVLVVSVGAAVLASVWPARRAARMSPVEGLAVE